ncbi:uncharacterized protein LOC123680871 [Harmonia axyridis]|uniref:uncharacterized protein LOC123680871 n=1 Tax=Harmonia axyridis TaxID=115357 RepID=UPI001E278219|nr:uncharacterized protein LOC123680871 [Harmonia axyridis]
MSSEDFRKPHREAIINKNIIVEGDQRELAEKQIDNRIDHDSGTRSNKVNQKKQSFFEAVKTLKVSKDKPKMILNKQVRKSTPDKDPVNSNKKKRENALNGTGDQNDLLQPAPKGRNWIWLGGLHSNTTVENIKAYTGMKWPDRDVLCFDLKSKSPKKSFKVGMIDISQEELLQPESWPSGSQVVLNNKTSCYYQNVRGLRTKLKELALTVSICDYDVIMLSETWLSADFDIAELGLNNYSVFRKDRDASTSNKKLGGGVLIAIKKRFHSCLIISDPSIEAVFVFAKFFSVKYIISNVYFPPNTGECLFKTYLNDLESIVDEYKGDIKLICGGDFNLPGDLWFDLSGDSICVMSRPQFMISNAIAMLDVKQINKIKNTNNTILDLIFVSQDNVEVFRASDELISCDPHHPPLCFDIPFEKIKTERDCEYFRDFKAANFEGIISCLSQTDWNLLIDNDMASSITAFYEVINHIINEYVPKRLKPKNSFPHWFSADLKKLISSKKAAHKKYKQTRISDDYDDFVVIRERCKAENRICFSEYVAKVEQSIRGDPKYFWKFINDRKQVKDLPSSMVLND